MGSEPDYDPASTPKLSLFSFPSKGKEPPGMLTPPVNIPASVPFQWEEAPGKPRPSCTNQSKPKPASVRCLELPPRLLSEAQVMNIPSPNTVLDGPYVGRPSSHTLSFRQGGSFRRENKEGLLFGSSRWGSFKKNKGGGGGSNNSDILSSAGVGGGGGGGGAKVKITRVRKRSMSFLSHKSHTSSSHMWTSICESFKQAVPWRRRQDQKLKKMES